MGVGGRGHRCHSSKLSRRSPGNWAHLGQALQGGGGPQACGLEWWVSHRALDFSPFCSVCIPHGEEWLSLGCVWQEGG